MRFLILSAGYFHLHGDCQTGKITLSEVVDGDGRPGKKLLFRINDKALPPMLRAAKDVLGEGEEFPPSLGTCPCVHSLYIDVLYTNAVVLLVGMGVKSKTLE